MIISFLGDSITQGCIVSEPGLDFVSLIAKKFPKYKICNYGLSGTRIARQENYNKDDDSVTYFYHTFNLDFVMRSEIIRKDSDYVFVFGGTNDFGHGVAPLGDISDNTPYTFNGALNCLYRKLVHTFGNKKIYIILPLHRSDEDSTRGSSYNQFDYNRPTLKEYSDAIKKACKRFDLNMLDFNEHFPKPITTNNEGLFADGLHPNDKGHVLLADLLTDVINKLE